MTYKAKLLVAVAALLATAHCQHSNPKKQLKFNENGKFKMVQFTDIHFGESDELD